MFWLKDFLKSKFFLKFQLIFENTDALYSFDIFHLFVWFWYFSDTTMTSPAWGARVWVCSCVHTGFLSMPQESYEDPTFSSPFPGTPPAGTSRWPTRRPSSSSSYNTSSQVFHVITSTKLVRFLIYNSRFLIISGWAPILWGLSLISSRRCSKLRILKPTQPIFIFHFLP